MGGLEVLLETALAQTAEDGEIVHLVPGQGAAGVIALVDADRGAIDDVIGVARFVIDPLEHLKARAVVRLEAEVVRLVVPRLVRQTVGVVLVAGKTGPAARTDGKEFRHKQATHAVGLILTEDVFDLAVRFGVVRAILHQIELIGAHGKGFKHLIEFGPGDKDLCLV